MASAVFYVLLFFIQDMNLSVFQLEEHSVERNPLPSNYTCNAGAKRAALFFQRKTVMF